MGEPPVELLSLEETYRADAAATEAGVAGAELMENAGRAVARAVAARYARRRVVVLCGPGNNGGDGFVAARHLQAMGWPVRLALLGSRDRLKGDAAHHAALWQGEVEALSPAALEDAELAVDAMFGAGLDRPLEGAPHDVVEVLHERRVPTVSVDVPSGINGDTGALVGRLAVAADLTVTFFRKKPGHLLLPGRGHCGETLLADIGIPARVLDDIAPRTLENGPGLWLAGYPWREADSHKYRFGHALVFGGGTVTGAGRLACRAALRVGAGLVSVAAPRAALPTYAASMPSLITLPLEDDESLGHLLADRRKNAVLLGPGNGVSEQTRWRALSTLETGRAVVLDADALTVFRDEPATLAASMYGPCVLTPHDGEFRRLFPDLRGDKLSRARSAAYAVGAVVLLKGGDTVVAAPDGRAAINANAPPELATAGTGDVLSGLVVGLLAQGLEAFQAACAATWLHGAAAAGLGPGLIAEDLPERLPAVLAELRRRTAIGQTTG